ncbi:MAG: hypothetical protein ACNI25_03430 [Halarcobacter sp.]
MNVAETQQNYTNYQTQSSNPTTNTESKEKFLDILENTGSYKTENTAKLKEEEYDEEYQLGLERYNAFQDGDNKWFEDSIFEKDQNAKNEFLYYLADLSVRDYMLLSGKFLNSFGGKLMEDENGNVVAEYHKKDPSKEFSSIGSIMKYFGNEIKDIEEGAKKFGGDISYMLELLTDAQNFFKDYQSKEQENQYKTMGNNQNAN